MFDGYITGFFECSTSIFLIKQSTVTSKEFSLFEILGHVEC